MKQKTRMGACRRKSRKTGAGFADKNRKGVGILL